MPIAASEWRSTAAGFSMIEVLVAFLQAYIFTLLSALFVGMAIHQEH